MFVSAPHNPPASRLHRSLPANRFRDILPCRGHCRLWPGPSADSPLWGVIAGLWHVGARINSCIKTKTQRIAAGIFEHFKSFTYQVIQWVTQYENAGSKSRLGSPHRFLTGMAGACGVGRGAIQGPCQTLGPDRGLRAPQGAHRETSSNLPTPTAPRLAPRVRWPGPAWKHR